MYKQCPLLHQNKPSRELNFCDGGALMDKMGGSYVKILAEKRTKWAGK